ncbi:MAG: hypothetical protein EOP48_11720 [Sphingobacteriales bacterium]|nr:MAG: hypothetical protein EOP48_11720 [Sphingobacteriales bacterium]
MKYEESLNEKTRALLEKLQTAGADITFELDNTASTWYVQERKSFKIASPNDSPNQAAMAHELLHVHLTLRGFSGGFEIYKQYNEANSICTSDFVGDLNNTLAHFKMIDDFLELGFNIDDFLQDTPKQYFLDSILFRTTMMVAQHNAGIVVDVCEQTRDIIMLCGSAKLFELYKIKDPNTKNGLHPDGVMTPLREINSDLIEGLDNLFKEWNEANTLDNPQFYFRLNALLQKLGIPSGNECK